MTRAIIWLSYDLGVRGDYAGLYSWLDARGAKECGDSLAVFTYEYEGNLQDTLLVDIETSVELNRRDRFYVIFREAQSGKIKGSFIHGSRRASAWTGFAPDTETADDEIA